MKLSNVLAVPQNLCADKKNGVKSVHYQSQCLVFATHFIQKKASGRMHLTSQNQRFRAVGMMEKERMRLQQQDNLECQNTVRLWLHHYRQLEWFPTSPTVGTPINDLAAGSLHHCHTPV